MNCNVCGQDFLRCSCVSQQPYCEQCSEDSSCAEQFPAECVIYHSYQTSPPSALTCLGLNNGSSIEHIVEVMGQAICNIHVEETALVAVDTSTINFTTSGTKGHNLTGSVKVSSVAGNEIEILSDGLHVTYTGKVKVSSTDSLDYLQDQIIGGSVQSFIQNTIQNDANVLEVIPTIDLGLLTDALGIKKVLVGDTSSIDLTLTHSSLTEDTITGVVKISADAGNIAVIHADGVFVDGSALLTDAKNGVNNTVSPGFIELGGNLLHDTSIDIVDPTIVNGLTISSTQNFGNTSYSTFNAFMKLQGTTNETAAGYKYAIGGQLITGNTGNISNPATDNHSYAGIYGTIIKTGNFNISGGNAFSGAHFRAFAADTGNIDKLAGVRVGGVDTAPLIFGGTYTGTIANYYGVLIEDISGSDYQARITNKYAIYQRGTTALNVFSTAATVSDERAKTNIKPFEKGLREIDNIRIVEFNYKDNLKDKKVGVIAQQVEQFIPEAVYTRPKDDIEDFKFVESQAIFYTLLNAVKELSLKVKLLESQLHA